MRAGALSADWSLGGIHGQVTPKERAVPSTAVSRTSVPWSQTYADEQIRGLVRHVFSPSFSPPVQQVVLTAVEHETDVRDLCQSMAELLAAEKHCEVGLLDQSAVCASDGNGGIHEVREQQPWRTQSVRQFATTNYRNVWTIPTQGSNALCLEGPSLCEYMAKLRREFEYSIVAAPAASSSSQALEMARFADGVILVVSARHTRRVTARKVRNAMAQVRLLGTVLSDREFPIPASIYRRL